MPSSRFVLRAILFCGVLNLVPCSARSEESDDSGEEIVDRFCIACHGHDTSEAGVNFAALLERDSFADRFRLWQNVVRQLEQKLMPPPDADQPTPAERDVLINWVRRQVLAAVRKHAGDPGHVVMRRLTSAEYGYAIRDLTGIDLEVERGFVSDAVGGAGFTNTGIVQFTQDATLERYLEAARRVADHAVIGTGPISFFPDPGETGFELSAINRILKIYRENGFRSAAGEGGEAFGSELYPKAFLTAWRFQHRERFGDPDATLASLAQTAGISVRFAEYIFRIVSKNDWSFPTSEISAAWRRLPVPDPDNLPDPGFIEQECQKLGHLLRDWQYRFGANPDAKEEAPVLRADLFDVRRTQPFEMNVNWPAGTKAAHLVLRVESANRNGSPRAVILWKNPQIQFRDYAKRLDDPKPLREFLTRETNARLGFGKHPGGGAVTPLDFVSVGTNSLGFELPVPEGARSARMLVNAELDVEHGDDCIVRCTIAQLEETDQGKSVSGLLASPDSKAFAGWKAGVLEFARLLPQMSQREPAPSDRDPIPEPIDSSYNNPERNFFHTRIKYFRDDAFLVQNMLDDRTRLQLDQAWADLLGSFEFHETWLQLLARRFDLQLSDRRIETLDDDWITAAPPEARHYLNRLRTEYRAIRAMFADAESRHVADVVRFAEQAWRRPLTMAEQDELYRFYGTLRTDARLDHPASTRALIARVLVSPAFLYRAERVPTDSTANGRSTAELTPWELASRLSFFLWASVPDEELRRAAAVGELQTTAELVGQTERMLKDEKSRRLAIEFFGQWFGFYRFGQYRGIDTGEYPEFTESLRSAMFDEAVEFFDYIVRNDRPVNEILFADYSFLNEELAAHYGLDVKLDGITRMQRVSDARQLHRGGLLRLGSILVTTSAPRRTSPVKRGDWVLRRVLGTHVPPPPADAGSIAAGEVVADGLSIRQRLEAHRRDSSCHNCHSRFDALGFALESYDPLGRWRNQYRDQKPVETSGTLRDGTVITGDRDLHEYLARQLPDFHRTLARKLLGYALGRRESVGDQPLISDLIDHMQNGGGMPGLVKRIVSSRQFRYHQASLRETSSATSAEPSDE